MSYRRKSQTSKGHGGSSDDENDSASESGSDMSAMDMDGVHSESDEDSLEEPVHISKKRGKNDRSDDVFAPVSADFEEQMNANMAALGPKGEFLGKQKSNSIKPARNAKKARRH